MCVKIILITLFVPGNIAPLRRVLLSGERRYYEENLVEML